jgi:hypothetical protein
VLCWNECDVLTEGSGDLLLFYKVYSLWENNCEKYIQSNDDATIEIFFEDFHFSFRWNFEFIFIFHYKDW